MYESYMAISVVEFQARQYKNLVDFWLEINRLTKKIDVTWNAIMAKNLPNLVNPSLKIHI